MSENNGFNVIDAPRKGGKSAYAKMAEALKSLPDGKAIQAEIKNIANIHTTMRRLGIAVRTSKISDGVYAIWQRRP